MDTHDAGLDGIIEALLDVHDGLGPGHPTEAYQAALALELARRQVPFRRDAILPVWYRGARLATGHPVPFLCHGRIVVDVRAEAIGRHDEAWVHNVLRGTRSPMALLACLGMARPDLRRFVSDGVVGHMQGVDLARRPASGSAPAA